MVKALKKQQTKPKQVVSDAQRSRLRKWNFGFAVLLVAQALAIVMIGGSQTVPITTQYLTTDTLASEANGYQVLAVATRHLFDVHLSWLVAKFLLIFAGIFLLAATFLRGRYESWLERGVNQLRWVGIGLGGGVMAVTVATLSGFSDAAFLVFIFGSVFVAGLSALIVELLGPDRRLTRLVVGVAVLAAILPWLAFAGTVISVAVFDGSLPNFVYYIYGSMLLMTIAGLSAGCLRLKQRGKWADTVYAERMFMLFAFVVASVLAWQIFAGALK